MLKKKGLTLIESMVALAVAGTASAAFIGNQIENNEINEAQTKGRELSQLISAFDGRIATDGYDAAKWNKTEWNDSTFYSDFTVKQLNSKDACGNSSWTPVNSTEAKIKPLPCDGLWKVNPYGLELSAEISKDSADLIDGFNIEMAFTNDEHFEEEFKNVKRMLNSARANSRHEIAGEHNFYFIDKSTGTELTTSECILEAGNCAIRGEFNRSGGSEYVRADGSNSMINSHLTFIEAKGQSPLKCVRWAKSTSGSWLPKTEEDCGIGIYKKSGEALVVEVVADNGTFNSVSLDKSCSKLAWNGSSVVKSGGSVPCGMHAGNTGDEMIQVVENTQTLKAFIEDLNASEINAGLANIDSIVSDRIETKDLEVTRKAIIKELEAENAIINNNLGVGGNVTVGGTIKADRVEAQTSWFSRVDATYIDVDSGSIDNLTSKNIDTDKLDSTIINANTINSNTVNATTGNFNNINNRLDMIEDAINDMNTTPSEPDTAEQEAACNALPDKRVSYQAPSKCEDGYAIYADYFWNTSAKFCDTRNYTKVLSMTGSQKECSGGGR